MRDVFVEGGEEDAVTMVSIKRRRKRVCWGGGGGPSKVRKVEWGWWK